MNGNQEISFNNKGYIRIELSKGIDYKTRDRGSYLWKRREERFFEFDDAKSVFNELMLYMNNHDYPFDAEWDNKREMDMDLLSQFRKTRKKEEN